MSPAEAAASLRRYNEWRRGDEDIPQFYPRKLGEAIDAAIEMIEAAEEDRALCDKLADILTRTANVLKGEPKPLHRNGLHDLPDVARKLVAAAGQNTVNAVLAGMGAERFAALVAAAEREACAKVCEESMGAHRARVFNEELADRAAAIRARGNR